MKKPRASLTVACETGKSAFSPSVVVQNIFALLHAESVVYCVTHGYQDLPDSWGSDIDILVERRLGSNSIAHALTRHRDKIGATVVCHDGSRIVLACGSVQGIPQFIVLDICHDIRFRSCVQLTGEQLLSQRRFRNGLYVPSTVSAFQIELAKGIAKNRPDKKLGRRLDELYSEDSLGIRTEISRRWPAKEAELLLVAAETGEWHTVALNSKWLTRALVISLTRQAPGKLLGLLVADNMARITRILRPRGRHIVFLGPDGAGKSSTIEALVGGLSPLFSRTEVRGFAPSLRQLLRRPARSTSSPHGHSTRSWPTSLLRAAYWCAYALATRVSLRWAKTRSTLILNDRHFNDVLVDPVRYRYGGPRWTLQIASWLSPKPDLVILLTGDPEVIQARKKELSVPETARFCNAYATLVNPLPYGRTVDTGKPFDIVVGSVVNAVMGTLDR